MRSDFRHIPVRRRSSGTREGTRPNGFLWPTLVRFTPSRVDVEIHRMSTDETRVYALPRVLPGNEDLSGRQDRTGFPE